MSFSVSGQHCSHFAAYFELGDKHNLVIKNDFNNIQLEDNVTICFKKNSKKTLTNELNQIDSILIGTGHHLSFAKPNG